MKKLLIVDGNSILNRAYYGIRPLTAPDGTPTNAVYGFLNILFKYLEEDRPDFICVAFDVKEKTFRHKMFDQYKAQRKPAPEDFIAQLPVIKEVLSAMNIKCLEKDGYEADDIIGTVSRICEEKGIECSVLTGDKDDLQLASELIKIKLVITRMGQTTTTVYDHNGVYEKYGVTPSEFIDVKGLMGDTSDNIPGVKGIGEKTAFSLIQQYKSIENIYEKFEEIEATPSVKKKLEEGKEDAYLSKTLATIERNVPMDLPVEEFLLGEYDNETLGALFLRLNFKSFVKKLGVEVKAPETVKIEGKLIRITPENAPIGKKIFVKFYGDDLAYTENGTDIYYVENTDKEFLKKVFEGDAEKISYDLKSDILYLRNIGIEYNNAIFDIVIGAYILNPSKADYDLDRLAFDMLGVSIDKNSEDNGQLTMDFGDNKDDVVSEMAVISRLYEKISEELKNNGQTDLYEKIEFPLIEVLADMQTEGVFVDKDELNAFGKKLKIRIEELEKLIYAEAGHKFNINSPKQLGEVLFEEMGLPHGKKTKTGYSTNVDVLNKLAPSYEIVSYVLEYRHLAKLRSTYVDGLIGVIDEKTGRIHSNFNQTITATGRLSSTEPNLQNIPVRTELGREIRKMFIAEGDRLFVDADYSQIELRVLAHIAGDKNMQEAFISGTDIHTKTASEVFHTPIDQVTSMMRSRAKAVNFGIVYGIGEFSLAQDLKISIKEAKQYIEDYLKHYPAVKEYMENTISKGREDGFVSTIFGRRRYIPELSVSNKMTQAFGERVAMNAPIQGTAADIIKIAMVNVYRKLKESGLKSKLILQIHDELIVETYPDELDRVMEIVKTEMENATSLSVPLIVDINSGKSWYDTK